MNKLAQILTMIDPGNIFRPVDYQSDVPKECWGRKITSVRDSKHEPKIGRNDLCPCKSGLKYKHCCMK